MFSIIEKMYPPVLPDTNSLIYSIKHKIDLLNEVSSMSGMGKIVILSCVLDELKGLSTRVQEARAAITLADRFQTFESVGKGDDCIAEYAIKSGGIVLTNDRALIARLKKSGLRVLSVRGGKRIHFV